MNEHPFVGGTSRHIAATQSGFSLVEIAVVMVILSLLLGGALLPLSVQLEKRDRDSTRRGLEQIREALLGYVLVNGRLPCPDTDGDGLINGSTSCISASGTLPWADLGVGKTDAWGQAYIYRVTPSFADAIDGTGCTGPSTGVSFSLCSDGDILIYDSAGGALVADKLPAVVVSRGKNWAISTAANEVENNNNDAVFVDADYSTNAAAEFDDLLIWVSPNILKQHMVAVSLLP